MGLQVNLRTVLNTGVYSTREPYIIKQNRWQCSEQKNFYWIPVKASTTEELRDSFCVLQSMINRRALDLY